ncbi:MAG: HPr family phosphocarrier protein [Spirochaetia bacterium]|nr:HPr family phosphocarrier protein [Spirochaetota bacterium]MCX8097306.1 HPr family phosphocarrier protein [Spirochaetota bacterium]MDW8112845.1 HPr family phosphocarrier protein [Spirochaetia bacterium]
MIRKKFTITGKYGVHLRPAVRIYETVKDFKSRVEIKKDDNVVDARSTLGIIVLNILPGDTIEVIANGVDEEEVIQKLTELIEHKRLEEDKDD